MAYEKQTWVDGVTPLDAEHLNHMEEGISQASAKTEEMEEKIPSYVDNAIANAIGTALEASY